MSPAVACAFIQKAYEYCFHEDNDICIQNVNILYASTLKSHQLTDDQIEFANTFRSKELASKLSLALERLLYLKLREILTM